MQVQERLLTSCCMFDRCDTSVGTGQAALLYGAALSAFNAVAQESCKACIITQIFLCMTPTPGHRCMQAQPVDAAATNAPTIATWSTLLPMKHRANGSKHAADALRTMHGRQLRHEFALGEGGGTLWRHGRCFQNL